MFGGDSNWDMPLELAAPSPLTQSERDLARPSSSEVSWRSFEAARAAELENLSGVNGVSESRTRWHGAPLSTPIASGSRCDHAVLLKHFVEGRVAATVMPAAFVPMLLRTLGGSPARIDGE